MQLRHSLTLPLRHTIESHRALLVRVAIIMGVVVLSALIASRMPSGRTAMVLLALPGVAAGIVFLLNRPGFGLVLLVVAGLLVPFSIGTGTGTTLNPVVLLIPLLTGLWLLDMAMRQRSIRFHRHPAISILIALCAVVVLAFIVGQLPWYSTPGAGLASQIGGMLVFFLSAAAFLVSAHTLTERRLTALVLVFLGVGAAYMGASLIPPLRSLVFRLFDPGATGSIFWIWMVALSGGLAMFWDSMRPAFRIGLAGLAVVILVVALRQNLSWASGWAPPMIAALILIWLRFPRWGWLPLVLAGLGFLVQQETLWAATTDSQSWHARRQAWEIVLDAAMINPLLGLGPSNYYFIVEQYTIGGWGGTWNVKFNSHNNYVDLIAQTGLIGLSLFLAFAAVMGNAAWKLYRRLPDGFARAYAAACVAGLIATLVSGMLGDWFLPFVYNIGLAGMRSSILFWVFMGGLLALHECDASADPDMKAGFGAQGPTVLVKTYSA